MYLLSFSGVTTTVNMAIAQDHPAMCVIATSGGQEMNANQTAAVTITVPV
jgi:hypothetical protein